MMAAISQRVALEAEVLVLSETVGSAPGASAGKPAVVEVKELDAGQGRDGEACVGRIVVHGSDVCRTTTTSEAAARRRRAYRFRSPSRCLTVSPPRN